MEKCQNISFLTISVLVFILSPVLSTQETADPGVIYVLAIIIPTAIYSVSKSYIRLTHYNILAILLWVFAILSTLVGPFGSFNLTAIKYLCFVIYFISVSTYSYTKKDLLTISRIYNYVSIGVAILIVLSFLGGYTHNDSEYFMGRYSIGITGLYKNPNYLVSFINVTLFLLLYSALYGRGVNRFVKIFNIAIILLFLMAFYLTGTRASLVTAFIIIFFLVTHYLFHHNRRIWVFVPTLIISLLIIYNWSTLTNLYELFMGTRDLMSDSSREDAWTLAFKHITDNPILGCGLFSWDNICRSGNYLEWLHNIYLELVLNQGLFGFLLFVLMVFSGFNKTKKNDRFFIAVLLFVTGFPMMFQNGVIAVNLWRFVIINRIVFNYSIRNEDGLTKTVFNNI